MDGFKLDFIDNFTFSEDAPANEDMDFSCVQDAVYELMSSVKRELSAIKPDIMIEFRQGYIGPGMCEFREYVQSCGLPRKLYDEQNLYS